KLWMKKEDVNAEKCRSYLFTAAYHKLVDYTRKADRMELVEKYPASQEGYHPAEPDLQDILHKALDKLPDVQKTVILLRDYEGYSYEEIGTITELSEAQVKVYIYRGRLAMKNYIGSLETIL